VKYFAYGSNMSLARLGARITGAQRLGVYHLKEHDLRFHKIGLDGSGKGDAFYTADSQDTVIGTLFEIDLEAKLILDEIEGWGYDTKEIVISNGLGEEATAFTYYATEMDVSLKPYSWYHQHIVIGAREAALPEHYITRIEAVESIPDPDQERDSLQRAIHSST